MRGLDQRHLSPSVRRAIARRAAERGDSIGSEDGPCDSLLISVGTLFGLAGECRDTVDLQRLETGWTTLDADFAGITGSGAVPPEVITQYTTDSLGFKAWAAEMRSTDASYTTYGEQVQQFDAWGSRLQAWRVKFQAFAGHPASGPDVVPTASAGGGGVLSGLSDTAKSLTTLALVGVGAYVVFQMVKK
jgi:hypothetical protein